MSQIWKFPILPASPGPAGTDYAITEISMPHQRILHVDVQDGQPMLWAEVQPRTPPKEYGFFIVPTGAELPPDVGVYVGTWQLDGMVWHLFRSRR